MNIIKPGKLITVSLKLATVISLGKVLCKAQNAGPKKSWNKATLPTSHRNRDPWRHSGTSRPPALSVNLNISTLCSWHAQYRRRKAKVRCHPRGWLVVFLQKLPLHKGSQGAGAQCWCKAGKCQALVDFWAWMGDRTPTKSNFPRFNRYHGDRILLQENSKGWENYALHALFPQTKHKCTLFVRIIT